MEKAEMAGGLSAEEMTGDLKREKKRPSAALTGDERAEEEAAEANKRPRTEAAAEETCHDDHHHHEEEPERKKKKRSCCTEPACCKGEEMKTKTTGRRYAQEYVDYILSWNTDYKQIRNLPVHNETTEEEEGGMRLYAMEYWTELRARKRALQEFVKAQVDARGYAEMPKEATQPPKYYDDDGEEMVYLGFGIYDE